jgi:dipeptidyl aminopeptidase/acylaminoacyl peptidase
VRVISAMLAAVAAALLLAACGDDPVDVNDSGLEPTSRWSMPVGRYEGEQPRAVLILVHGGAWRGLDRRQFEGTLAQALVYQQAGYATLTVDYRAGADGITDLERFYKQAESRFPDLPICAIGSSAGGHLSLMLAAREPELDCVVSFAGPTDLAGLSEQEGGEDTYTYASDAFGEDELARYSPVDYADKIKASVFLAGAVNDPLLPTAQVTEFAEVLPGTETVILPEGQEPWIHSPGVDSQAKQQMNVAIAGFLDRVVAAN